MYGTKAVKELPRISQFIGKHRFESIFMPVSAC
jgi:hypothetical protein